MEARAKEGWRKRRETNAVETKDPKEEVEFTLDPIAGCVSSDYISAAAFVSSTPSLGGLDPCAMFAAISGYPWSRF